MTFWKFITEHGDTHKVDVFVSNGCRFVYTFRSTSHFVYRTTRVRQLVVKIFYPASDKNTNMQIVSTSSLAVTFYLPDSLKEGLYCTNKCLIEHKFPLNLRGWLSLLLRFRKMNISVDFCFNLIESQNSSVFYFNCPSNPNCWVIYLKKNNLRNLVTLVYESEAYAMGQPRQTKCQIDRLNVSQKNVTEQIV